MKQYYKSPLTIYVVWHHLNQYGIKYAEALYNTFCRDANSPLVRALSIPVLFRYAPAEGDVPLDIETSESDNNAIILLVEDKMFADEKWFGYVQSLLKKEKKEENTRMFPVALSDYAFAFDEQNLGTKQFINLVKYQQIGDHSSIESGIAELKSRLLHDLSRMLYKVDKVTDAHLQRFPPPASLFISHAKLDGETLAKEFRDYIGGSLKLKSFFDVNDIADADDFGEAIRENVKNAAVVVFLSDQYSTREWCLIEVIVAKRNKSPLVVVNNLETGEKRSFPYLGNVPTIRYKENCFPKIIDLALYQVLNNLYIKLKLEKEIELYNLRDKYITYQIQNAPELFTYIDIKRLQNENENKKILVLYPDPPLGKEELKVLNDMDANIYFITPSLINKV